MVFQLIPIICEPNNKRDDVLLETSGKSSSMGSIMESGVCDGGDDIAQIMKRGFVNVEILARQSVPELVWLKV